MSTCRFWSCLAWLLVLGWGRGHETLWSAETQSTPAELPEFSRRGPFMGLHKFSDMPLRDTSICRGPDGTWYLTGTVQPFWDYNEGIKVWRSPDLTTGTLWEWCGTTAVSPWHAKVLAGEEEAALGAVRSTSSRERSGSPTVSPDGTALGRPRAADCSRSTSGKAEGPYEDIQPDERWATRLTRHSSRTMMASLLPLALREDRTDEAGHEWFGGAVSLA